MATWAKGIDFKNSSNTTRIGGIGIYGIDNTSEKIYLGFGSEPWNNTGLEIKSNIMNFKGNKVYHAGDKPTLAELGAASSSHTHSYLPLTGGTITGALSISGHNGLIANSSKRVFWYHNNQHITISAGGSAGDLYLGFNSGTDYQTNNVRLESPMNWKGGTTIVDSSGKISWSILKDIPSLFRGNGTVSTEDWNTLNTLGLYSISNFSGTNSPSGAYQWGGMLSLRNGYATGQIYLAHSNNELWIRSGWNGTYNTSWSRVYTTSYKPTPEDIGAATASHTHSYLPLSGGTLTGRLAMNITGRVATFGNPSGNSPATGIANQTAYIEIAAPSNTSHNSKTGIVFHHSNTSTNVLEYINTDANTGYFNFRSDDSSWNVRVNGNAIYHAGNKPTPAEIGAAASSHGHSNINSRGAVTCETGTGRPAVGGMSMTEVYNNGYPTSYGNVLTLRGSGDGQILVGWSGTSGAHDGVWVRSKRDVSDAAWSGWTRVYTEAYKPYHWGTGNPSNTDGKPDGTIYFKYV